jgi:hypothetical protein
MHMVGKPLKFSTSMSPYVWGGVTHLSLQLPPQSGRLCNFMTKSSLLTFFFLYQQMTWITRILGLQPSLNASRSSLHISLFLSPIFISCIMYNIIMIILIYCIITIINFYLSDAPTYVHPTQTRHMWFLSDGNEKKIK